MKRFAGLFAVVAVMLALTFPTLAPASAAPERHPEIQDAIACLRNAKDHLEHARHDFGGHRADALHATDEAIHQLEICMKYEN